MKMAPVYTTPFLRLPSKFCQVLILLNSRETNDAGYWLNAGGKKVKKKQDH